MKRRVTALAPLALALSFFLLALPAAQAQDSGPIRVTTATKHDLSPPLRSISATAVRGVEKPIIPNKKLPVRFLSSRRAGLDPVVQLDGGLIGLQAPLTNFDGLGNQDNEDLTSEGGIGRVTPPDPDVDVGPNHVVQLVNDAIAVYDRQGNIDPDFPKINNAVFEGFGGPCEFNNNGDVIVLYDQHADRWLNTFMSWPDGVAADARGIECVAISQTGDPAGAYYRYEFLVSENGVNDYPKIGVGPDGYYGAYNIFGPGFNGSLVSVFEKDSMLVGGDARLITFGPSTARASLLPSDTDGDPLPDGSPAYFSEIQQDQLNIYAFQTNWDDPQSSTFGQVADLDVAPFDNNLAGIPQPDTGEDLDDLADRLMQRFALRDMGGYFAAVVNHTVDADGTGRAGVRWYELRDDGSGWSVYQQGTYAPDDGNNRWMGSIAMNADGAIALIYTVSNDTDTYPSIRYTGRPAGAPLGEMTFNEQSIIEGNVPVTTPQNAGRWGDYAAIVPDPTDDLTFWGTHEHGVEPVSAFANWDTRIAAFAFDTDDDVPPGAIADLEAEGLGSNVELTWTAPADDAGDPESGPVAFYQIRYSTEGAITDSADFAEATPVENVPGPAEPGTEQGFIVEDLAFDTQYWFAIRAVDDNSNGTLSNSPSATTGSAPILAFAPDTLEATLEANEQDTTLALTLTNEGPADSDLTFTFPAFAAEAVLNRPGAQLNDVTRPVAGPTDHTKGKDTFEGAGHPVTLGAGGPDDFGYKWIDSNEEGGPAFNWTDISDVGTALSLGDDASETVDLPFAFEFYGEEKTQLTISSNGYATFGQDGTDFSNDPVPTTDDPNDALFPFWDDLDLGDGQGTVYYLDDEDNERFVVQWDEAPGFPGPGGDDEGLYTFQLILGEDGGILFQYLDVESEGDTESATVGIENADGTDGLQIAFNTNYVEDSLAVAIAAVPPFIADVDPASGTLAGGESQTVDVTFSSLDLQPGFYESELTLVTNDPDALVTNIPAELDVFGGAADIAVVPDSIDFGEVLEGDVASRSFTIFNNGGGPLLITDVTVTNEAFRLNFGGEATIPFGDSLSVEVVFEPGGLGTFTGEVLVESSDPDTPTATVYVEGEGVPAPIIALSPDSLSETLEIGQTATDTLVVANLGEGVLEFEAFFQEESDDTTMAPEDVAARAPASRARADVGPDVFSAAGRSGPANPTPADPENATYQIDDGTAENAIGLTAGGDVMWLNAFEAVDGTDTITEISTAWGSPGGGGLPPEGAQATALLYEDPNDDGDPSDAELLLSTDITVTDPGTDMFTAVSISPTEVQGTFFVAILYRNQPANVFPAPIDESSTYQDASWVVGTTSSGTFNEEDLSDNELPPSLLGDVGLPGNWLLRADSQGGGGGGGIISVVPDSGSVAPGDSTQLLVQYDATGLDVGTYSGDIVVQSNDPQDPVATVPVTLEVESAPYPFALSPDAIEVTIDLADGDTTNDAVTRDFTIENITDEEQFFLIETNSVAGNAPFFRNFLTPEAEADILRREARARAGDYPRSDAAPALGPVPGSRQARSAHPMAGLLVPDSTDAETAYGTSVFGDNSGQFVQFNLGAPMDLTPFAPSPIAFAGDFEPGDENVFYIIESGTNVLFAVDKETGDLEEQGTLTPNEGEVWTELAGDPTSGAFYATAGSAEGSTLYTVDADEGEANEIAPITIDGNPTPFIISIALDGSGQMYGYEIVNDLFLEIDKQTGEATVVGPIGFDANFAQGLDYDLDSGTLYMAAYNAGLSQGELRVVDLDTGETVVVGLLGNGEELGYIALPSGGFLFVDVDLISGTLAPMGEVTLEAQIDAEGLLAGTYEAEIVVISNEPGMPQDEIPVTLEVLGDPEATLLPMALDFGEVFVGADSTALITLQNTGIDDLEVSGVQVSPDVFSIPDSVETSFTLEPGEAETFAVTFVPDAVQEYTGTLTVMSNNPGGNVTATLTGEGIAAPVIAVSPDALDFALEPGETETQTLEITNTGGNPLVYAISDTLISAPGDSLGGDAPEPSAAFEDVIFEEDFNDGIPSDWTVTDLAGGGLEWQLNTDFGSDNYTGGTGTAAMADSDAFGPAAFDTELISPEITANADNLTLSYKANYQNLAELDTLDVGISTDGGASWTNVLRWAEDHGGFFAPPGETVELSLDSLVSAGDAFQVRWRYYDTRAGAFDWYAQIDDVRVARSLEFLAVSPASGTLAPGETDEVEVSVDATGLPEGLYEVQLAIASNDPANEEVIVPVDVLVGAGAGGGVVVTPGPGPDSTRTVAPGEEFLVPVTVSGLNGSDVESYQFTLSFMESLLEPLGAETEGTLSEGAALVVNTSVPGQISVAAVDTTGNGNGEGDGTLVFVRLRAMQEMGTTELAFTSFQFNEGEPEVVTETTSVEVGRRDGDVSGDGTITAFDANLVLEYVVGLTDLSAEALEAADVSGNEVVTAFDASLIFDFVLGRIDCFPSEAGCGAAAQPALALVGGGAEQGAVAAMSWGEPQQQRGDASSGASAAGASSLRLAGGADGPAFEIPLALDGAGAAVRAVQLTAQLDLGQVTLEGVEAAAGLPDGWEMAHHVTDGGVLKVAMAGPTPLEGGGPLATVKLRWLEAPGSNASSGGALAGGGTNAFAGQRLSLGGEAVINEAAPQRLASAEVSVIPEAFAVSGNYPNPFRNHTEIALNLPQKAKVSLMVYDVLGRQVLRIEGREMAAGTGRTLGISGARLPSGTYLYRVTAEVEGEKPQVATGRMVLVK